MKCAGDSCLLFDKRFGVTSNEVSAKDGDAEYISSLKPSQSPIALYKQRSPPLKQLKPLVLDGYFNDKAGCSIVNTGQTAYFTFNDGQPRPSVSGGPLVGKYVFEQLHFHWSVDEVTGCEHIVDGRGYAMEAHFVHYNEKYGSLEKAINHPDGLAVVGFLISVGEKANPGFEEFAAAVRQISPPSQKATLKPASLSWIKKPELYSTYFSYKGSLTTPPFSECVTWIVHDTPVEIGPEQIAAFHDLKSSKDKAIERNVRPTQRCPKGHTVHYVHSSAKSKL